MTACAHVSDSGNPCGRPVVAVWEHPVTGSWPLCQRHHDAARQAIAMSAFVGTDWVFEECPQPSQEGRGDPQPVGAA